MNDKSGFFEEFIRVIAIAPGDEADIKIRVMSGRNIDIAVADEEGFIGCDMISCQKMIDKIRIGFFWFPLFVTIDSVKEILAEKTRDNRFGKVVGFVAGDE